MLHQAAIWADLAQAAIDAETAPPKTHPRYLAWLLDDEEEIPPAELTMSLPG